MSAAPTFTRDELRALHMANRDKATAEIRKIAGKAAAEAGMTLARLIGPDQTLPVVKVRDIVCYVAAREGYSLPQIGRAMNRDPSSVGTAIRREKARRGEA
ncbi:helix-turn-helix domain-containing protein [Paracoccus sp. 22332]|uniref:helix-turn-helix domain-containing protein n=1 Tax=Paracoccus sp. 22332 TaxID=3453913 RepID=UPI003F850BCB